MDAHITKTLPRKRKAEKAIGLLFLSCYILIFSFNRVLGQTQSPPEVDFNKYYWPVNRPGGGTQTDAASGEDWFYDLKYATEDGKPYGFVGAGYSGFANMAGLSNGCNVYTVDNTISGDGNQTNFAMPVSNPYGWPAVGIGPVVPKIGFADTKGKQIWYNTYGSANGKYGSGVFYNIIQTSDEGFIAVGKLSIGNAIKYNPTSLNPAGDGFGCKPGGSLGRGQGYIAKTDVDGNLQWQFLYGMANSPFDALFTATVLYEVIPFTSGNYLVLGKSEVAGLNMFTISLFEINANGVTQRRTQFIAPLQTSFTEVGNVGRRMIYVPSKNAVYISGMIFRQSVAPNSKAVAMVVKVDPATLSPVGSPFLLESTLAPNPYEADNIAFDIEYNAVQDKLLAALITDDYCGSCGENFVEHGTGLVYQINPTTMIGTQVANIGTVKAFDLAIDLTVTTDGGYVVCSTKQSVRPDNCQHPFPPYSSITSCVQPGPIYSLGYEKDKWNTNCYVEKFSVTNSTQWNKTIYESTPNANKGNYDNVNIPPHTQGNVGNPQLQGDLKREECLYRIVRTPYDDGLAICGNNSNNMDDDVIIKLHSLCQKLQAYDINTTQDISTSVTWNTSKKVNDEIRVLNGGILTITGASTTIQFSDTRQVGKPVRIIVYPGGKLKINNGAKVTGLLDCPNKTWEGIMVLGNSPLAQLPETNQGVIEITNASIENARNAVTAGIMAYSQNNTGQVDYSLEMVPFYWFGAGGGGIIKASNASFLNNRTSVRMHPYVYVSSGTEAVNRSFFNLTTFRIDDNMPPTEHLEQFVWLNNVNGVNFRGCKFANDFTNLTETDEMGIGIYSINANYNVKEYCLSIPCLSFKTSSFKNLWYGIRGTHISGTRTFSVNRATFTGNIFGVKVEGVNNVSLTLNDFTVGNSPVAQSSNTGVFIETGTGYIVEENDFFKASTVTSDPIGVTITNTGTGANQVYKNFFNQMDICNLSNFRNRNVAGDVGLQFLCNAYHNTLNVDEGATAILPTEGVRIQQGIFTAPAGNCFSNPLFNIYYFSSNAMEYFYYTAGGACVEYPNVVAGNVQRILTTTPLTPQCLSHLSGGGCIGCFALSGQQNENNQRDYLLSKRARDNYQMLLDNVQGVNNTASLQADQLRNQLLGNLQFSGDVSQRALKNFDNSPDEALYQMLNAYPGTLSGDNILKHSDFGQNLMPQWLSSLLALQTHGITTKTLLQAGIEYHQNQMDLAGRAILNSILSMDGDGAELNHVELRQWLAAFNELSADYAIVEDYFSIGEADKAIQLAESLDELHSMDEMEKTDYSSLLKIYKIQAALENRERDWDAMNEVQLTEVKELADNEHPDAAGIRAKNILRAYYGARYESYPQIPPFDKVGTDGFHVGVNPPMSGIELNVYPNPSDGSITFDYKTGLKSNASLLITDALGGTVYQASLTDGAGQTTVNTSQLNNGIYYYRLSGKGFSSLNGKFVIVH